MNLIEKHVQSDRAPLKCHQLSGIYTRKCLSFRSGWRHVCQAARAKKDSKNAHIAHRNHNCAHQTMNIMAECGRVARDRAIHIESTYLLVRFARHTHSQIQAKINMGSPLSANRNAYMRFFHVKTISSTDEWHSVALRQFLSSHSGCCFLPRNEAMYAFWQDTLKCSEQTKQWRYSRAVSFFRFTLNLVCRAERSVRPDNPIRPIPASQNTCKLFQTRFI